MEDVTQPARSGWSDVPGRLRLALLISVLGAGLAAVGLALRPVAAAAAGAAAGTVPPAGFSALPLLIALAVLPVVLAAVAVAVGRPVVASGVLIGFALLAPGRVLVDLQFARDALLAARPELLVPTSLAPLAAGPGLWLMLAGHVSMVVAGVLVIGSAGAQPGSAYAEALEDTNGAFDLPPDPATEPAGGPGAAASGTVGSSTAGSSTVGSSSVGSSTVGPSVAAKEVRGADGRSTADAGPGSAGIRGQVGVGVGGPGSAAGRRRYLIGWVLVSAALAAVGLLLPAFRSGNALQLAPGVIDSAMPARLGGLLIIAGVVLGCVLAVSPQPAPLTRGMTLGMFAGVAAVSLPPLVAGLVVDRLAPAPGPYLALGGAGLLAVVAFLWPRSGRPRTEYAELRLEARRMHQVTAALGLACGLAALAGGFGSLLVVEAGAVRLDSFANRQLIPAGIVVALLGAAMLVRGAGAALRPALAVAVASVVMVGAGALDAALTATGVSKTVHVGAGVWFAGVAMVLAAAAAIAAAVAGGAERDDVDLTERGVSLPVTVPAAAAVLLAVGAFGLPMVRAPEFVAPGIWSQFRLSSWGLLLGLAVVIAVAVLAPVSRPSRAAALLLGAAAVVGVHLLELPLTSGRVAQAGAGQGTWLSAACLVALVIAAVVAVSTRPSRR